VLESFLSKKRLQIDKVTYLKISDLPFSALSFKLMHLKLSIMLEVCFQDKGFLKGSLKMFYCACI